MTAVLQLDKRPSSRVHLVSYYAPTRATSREDKDAFFQELENSIFSVPSGKMYVLLGDFNARVGSRENVDEEWSSVRGVTACMVRPLARMALSPKPKTLNTRKKKNTF